MSADTKPVTDLNDADDDLLILLADKYLKDNSDTGDPEMMFQILKFKGTLLHNRFVNLGLVDDIDDAIECRNEVLSLASSPCADSPEAATALGDLGLSFMCRFTRLGELEDIDTAIDHLKRANSIATENHPEKPQLLADLGNCYQCRFDRLGRVDDIEQAIEHQNYAALLVSNSNDHDCKPGLLNGLGLSYKSRYEHFGSLADVGKAIECMEQALFLIPDQDQLDNLRPIVLYNLGVCYIRRYDRLGELSDVDRSIDYQVWAVKLVPDHHVIFKSAILDSLGSTCHDRFAHLGEIPDADKSIDYHRQAIALTPHDHPEKPRRLSNFGISYESRFKHLGEVADIDNAIAYQSQAIALGPLGHAECSSWLISLGNSHATRFRRRGELSDIEEAITCHTRAVSLVPDGHEKKPLALGALGGCYLSRFLRLDDTRDVEAAIDCTIQAMSLTPDGHPTKLLWLDNLGKCYSSRFLVEYELADIDKGIEYRKEAIALAAADFATKSKLLKDLAFTCLARFEYTGELQDIHSAIEFFQQAAQSPIGSPRVRFDAAREWAVAASSIDHPSTRQACEAAMRLLPQVVWLGVTVERRYESMAELGNIAVIASSWAISSGLYDLALEWLEQGRSIVWKQITQLRAPFDAESAADPDLVKSLKRVARDLELAGFRGSTNSLTTDVSDLEQEAQQHRQLALEWDKLLEQARCDPYLRTFLCPRKASELKHAAKDGPVVVMNVHTTRCDALILVPGRDEIAHIPLENFSYDKAVTAREELSFLIQGRGEDCDMARGVRRRSSQSENSFKIMLQTLWSDLVKPVLDFLGCTSELPIDDLPHITWCTTGPLSFLPLHAAGPYEPSQSNTFDLVISSYTPTLSAQLVSTPQTSNTVSGVLAVGQESTEGFPTLSYTGNELAEIRAHAENSSYQQLSGEDATVVAVLNAMEQHSCVHFACHATQNAKDPTQSAFHLHDGDLTLAEIAKRSFKNKELAFLSACQTAAGDRELPDEAVHLAAGMLIAGYPSVIATMWGIADEDGPRVARRVYADLLKDRRPMEAAKALHRAVRELRDELGNAEACFERWVPFVHIGL